MDWLEMGLGVIGAACGTYSLYLQRVTSNINAAALDVKIRGHGYITDRLTKVRDDYGDVVETLPPTGSYVLVPLVMHNTSAQPVSISEITATSVTHAPLLVYQAGTIPSPDRFVTGYKTGPAGEAEPTYQRLPLPKLPMPLGFAPYEAKEGWIVFECDRMDWSSATSATLSVVTTRKTWKHTVQLRREPFAK